MGGPSVRHRPQFYTSRCGKTPTFVKRRLPREPTLFARSRVILFARSTGSWPSLSLPRRFTVSGKTRIILIVVAAVFVLLLILPYLIPVNQFRPTIEEKASAALGRKVQLGNLSFSLLGGSLSAENLSVGDDPKFSPSPFLTAKSLKVGVEIFPLIFSKSLNVTGVTIVEPQVTLLRNAAGQWNYSSLGGPAAKSSSSSSSSSSAGVSVAKLDLKDGRIIIGTTNSQKRSTYDHVDVATSDVSTTSSMNLATSGILDPSAGLGGLLDLEATVTSQGGEAQTKGTAKLSKALLVAGGAPAGVPLTVDFNTKYDLHKNAGLLNPSSLKIGSAVANLSGTYQTAATARLSI